MTIPLPDRCRNCSIGKHFHLYERECRERREPEDISCRCQAKPDRRRCTRCRKLIRMGSAYAVRDGGFRCVSCARVWGDPALFRQED